MYCYHCNNTLDLKKDTCPRCGRDVRMFKRIVYASNRKYNDALIKAQARDLSGAAEDLRVSLHLYKKNVPARNLLGLVSYAMGESVEALWQWRMAKNMSSTAGLADRFLSAMQKNMREVNSEANSIHRFNQALTSAKNNAKDMAVIHLKKVISSHPNMTKAYNLLALLYMESGKTAQAEQMLTKCLEIDRGNVDAIRYLKSLRDMAGSDAAKSLGTVGNEDREQLIIPVRFRDYGTYLSNALYIVLGLVLGILIAWFVIVPGRVESVSGNLENENRELLERNARLESMLAEGTEAPTEPGQAETGPGGESEEESKIEGTEEMPVIKRNVVTDGEEGTGWKKNQDDVLAVVTAVNAAPPRYAEAIFIFLRIDPTHLSKDPNQQHYRNLVNMLLKDNGIYNRIQLQAYEYKDTLHDYAQAALYFEALSFLHPEEVQYRKQAGDCYALAGNIDKAANFYWQAAVLFPGTTAATESQKRYIELKNTALMPPFLGTEAELEEYRKPIDADALLNSIGGGQ